MTPPLFNADQRKIIAQRYLNGEYSTSLAKEYKCTVNTILSVLRMENVEIRGYQKAFTPIQQTHIIERYRNGERVMSIAESYGHKSIGSILRVIHRHDEPMRGTKVLSSQQEQHLANDFLQEEIITDLAVKYECTIGTVKHILTRFSIDTKLQGKRSKYQLNRYAFDNLDNELIAYCLGFAYADGSVTNNAFRVNIQARDECILKTFQLALGSNAPIVHTRRKNYRDDKLLDAISLQITDAYLATRLKELGIIPKRRHFEMTLIHLPVIQYGNFIRGYLDGDGGITKNPKQPEVRFWGEEDILSWIRQIFANTLNTNPSLKLLQKIGVLELNYSGRKQCRRIMDWLYSNATVWLPRKRDAAKDWWPK